MNIPRQHNIVSQEVYTPTKSLSLPEELNNWFCPKWNKNAHEIH